MTKAAQTLFAAGTSVPAGTARGAPVLSQVVDARAAAGAGEMPFRITNGGAIGAPCTIMFQVSAVGGSSAADWFDYFPVSSKDLVSGTVTEGTVPASRPIMYWRAIAYGNTNNNCTVEAGIQLVTA